MESVPLYKQGFSVYNPREGAPDFVKGAIVIDVPTFVRYLEANSGGDGKVRLDLLLSKEGKLYAKKNDWEPTKKATEDVSSEDVPF